MKMGCFSTCFGKSKCCRRRRRHSHRCSPTTTPINTTTTTSTNPSLLQHLQKHESIDDFSISHLIHEQEEEEEEEVQETLNPTNSSPQSRSEEKREKVNSIERKKVTFNLNVKVYEDIPAYNIQQEEEVLKGKSGKTNEDDRKESKYCESQSPSNSSSSSLFSYPPNYRYQNCRDSDDEFDQVISSEESDIDDDDDYYTDEDYEGYGDGDDLDKEANTQNPSKPPQEQSSESLFSLSIDSRRKDLVTEVDDKEVNSPIPTRNSTLNDSNQSPTQFDLTKYVDSVLNPVENVNQWKVIKARSKLASKDHHQHQSKENVINFGQDLNFGLKKEIGVDTSLSSWLVGSEANTPNSKNSSVSVGNSGSERMKISPNKFEDRPILGALTVEEIRQFSASQSPRKSPSRSPDEMPIIGSVGSYWSHTGQTDECGSSAKSRSRLTESTKVIWDPTPFETRLEKALEQESTAEANVLRV